MSNKTSALLRLIRWDRPIGSLLLLWPTLWALWIAADGIPDPKLLVIFSIGTVLMRSAGCIINDLADATSTAASRAPATDRWSPARSRCRKPWRSSCAWDWPPSPWC
jgi:hypothetical protein